MNEIVQLNRFRKKCLETIYALSVIDATCEKMITEVTQDKLDSLAKLMQEYQDGNHEMQNYLMDFLKSVAEPTDEYEISSTESEEGYKL